MKKFLLIMLAALMLAALCACEKDNTVNTPTEHIFTPADCTTPKTCTLCGETEGEALGHSYKEGKCTLCTAAQPNYKAFESGAWCMDGLTTSGEELERITLSVGQEDSAISVSFWGDFDQCEKEYQDWYMAEGEGVIFEFEGKRFYPMGFGKWRDLSYTADGDTIVLTILEDEPIGTITMVRTAGDQYTVTEVTGRIIDSTITGAIPVGSVFTFSEK
jgi:hypothetical protein